MPSKPGYYWYYLRPFCPGSSRNRAKLLIPWILPCHPAEIFLVIAKSSSFCPSPVFQTGSIPRPGDVSIHFQISGLTSFSCFWEGALISFVSFTVLCYSFTRTFLFSNIRKILLNSTWYQIVLIVLVTGFISADIHGKGTLWSSLV